MVKRFSALENINETNLTSSLNFNDLKFIDNKNLVLFQISSWPNTINSLENNLIKLLNIKKFPENNTMQKNQDHTIIKIEPLSWWILGKKIKSIDPAIGSILDLSHSRTHLSIYGNNSSFLLKKHFPIDLRDKSFPENSVASTSFHHVSITLCKVKNGYEIFLPRAFANSLLEILIESSKQFNS